MRVGGRGREGGRVVLRNIRLLRSQLLDGLVLVDDRLVQREGRCQRVFLIFLVGTMVNVMWSIVDKSERQLLFQLQFAG